MKKRLLPILLLVLAMVFTGCTSTQLEFWNKMQEVQQWEAAEVKGTVNMTMSIQGETVNVAMDLDGMSNTKDMSSFINMSMKMDMPSDPTQSIEMKDIKMYMVDGQMAISKNYITDMLKVSGKEVPEELAREDVEYILLEVNPLQQELLAALTQDPAAIKEFYKTFADVAEDMGINVEVTKKGNTYSVDLDQTEICNLVKNIIVTGTNNLESLNKTFKLGLTAEEIKQAQVEMNSVQAEMDQIVQMISTMLTGSFKMDYTIEENVVTEKVTLVVDEPTFTGLKMNMDVAMTSKKVAPTTITMPEKVLQLTDAELAELIAGKVVMIDHTSNMMTTATGEFTPCKVVVENGKTFVPAKAVLGALGQEVVYDAQTKKVGIKANDTFKALNVITKEGTSYMSLEELQTLGYTVVPQGNYITIQ